MTLVRENATSLVMENSHEISVRIFANEHLTVQKTALQELQGVLELQSTVMAIREASPDFFGDQDPKIVKVAVMPDFHKGTGVPIGTVMQTRGFVCPQAPGSDINCGMRLYCTDLTEALVRDNIPALKRRLRHLFFGGGRQIPMRRRQRIALLQDGLVGLLATHRLAKGEGLWQQYCAVQQELDLDHVSSKGSLPTTRVFGLQDFLGSAELTRDSQIGSVGGGNHFVEIQKVSRIVDGTTAYAWGLKPSSIVVMIHTGSVSIGHQAGQHFTSLVKKIYPPALRHPANKLFCLPEGPQHKENWDDFWVAFSNATNFAYGNRLFLGLMVQQALAETIRESEFKLLYCAGHNTIQPQQDGTFLHRKGACQARGVAEMTGTPFAGTGEPVLVPGSMGTSSFILAGSGNPGSLESASHGAGRVLSAGKALKGNDQALDDFLSKFHIVTPVDPSRPDIKGRPDILRKWRDGIKKEAPWVYKDIDAVIQTQVAAGTVRAVAELQPILTIKG